MWKAYTMWLQVRIVRAMLVRSKGGNGLCRCVQASYVLQPHHLESVVGVGPTACRWDTRGARYGGGGESEDLPLPRANADARRGWREMLS